MKLCRFLPATATGPARIGLLQDDAVTDLSASGIQSLGQILETDQPAHHAQAAVRPDSPRLPLAQVRLLAPVENQEVWAAGVTYLRSKAARMEESDFSARAYDHVYEAPRPEIFFKALAAKVVGPGEPVGIRRDARWSVPEPELALVLNSRGRLAGFTTGNDMSSRDIEGENLLYLPQAKIYDRSCALGPCITLVDDEAVARQWSVSITIHRTGATVFSGSTPVDRIKRGFRELAEWLFRSQTFPHGAILLTGTGIVPPDAFTLAAEDVVEIHISGIGTLTNPVSVV